MAWDLKKELKRKTIHLLALSFIIIFVLVFTNFGKSLALLALVLLLVLFLEMEYFRLELGKKIPIISKIWRKKEKKRIGGHVFFLIGAIICFAVFDLDIAIAAILMTIFGDMAAALIGKRFGRTWITKKRAVEGILAELVVNLIIVFVVFGYSTGFNLASWVLMVVMAVTATTVETILNELDDNLIIPLFSGFNGQIVRLALKFFGM